MLALQMSGTFFVLVKIAGTKSWGKPGFLQVEASWDCHEPQVSWRPPLVSRQRHVEGRSSAS